MSNEIKFIYSGATGWDAVCAALYSEKRMARRIARKLCKTGGMYAGMVMPIYVQMPKSCYRVVPSDWNKLGEPIDWDVESDYGFAVPGGF